MASESDKQQTGGDPAVASADALTVNLQVVSPSVGVNRPLLFPGLPAATTIKQLKERIRQTLPLQPADENQRLIHRGRAIVREADTLLDIFGADTLRNPEQQTIHLVIRESADPAAAMGSNGANGARGRSLSPANPLSNLARQHLPQPNPVAGPQVPPGFVRRNINQSAPNLPVPRGPSPARPPVVEQNPGLQGAAAAQHAMAHQHAIAHQHALLHQQHQLQHQQFHPQHQNMTQWLTQLQREAMARQLISQNQRNRAQLGMRGIGDTAGANGAQPPESSSGRASPVPGHTIVREAWGPNGRTYQVETVIRASAPNPQQGLSPTDVHNILRGADANQATAAMTSAMQRSASGASLHNRPLTQPGVTTSIGVPALGTQPNSGRATPDFGYRFVPGGGTTSLSTPVQPAPRQGLDVYILSSPEGPRALLINNNTAETFYTPMLRSQRSRNFQDHAHATHETLQPHRVPETQPSPQTDQGQQHAGVAQEPAHQDQNEQQQQQQQQQQQLQQQQLEQQQQLQQQLRQQLQHGAAEVLQPHGQQIGGLPPLMVQVGPHIWMIFRLAFAVWLFTSPGLSWAKWLIMVGLAVFTFVMSTGILNGMVDRVWQPAARHLENLIRPVERADANGQQEAQQQGELDPAQMAARLLAEQRARETWVAGQMRRLERAGLLFLASIAPGVAERHIANLEAEARAERERREAAARAAAEAEAAAAAAAEAEANHNRGSAGEEPAAGNGEEATTNTQPPAPPVGEPEANAGEGQGEQQGGDVHREPLIAL